MALIVDFYIDSAFLDDCLLFLNQFVRQLKNVPLFVTKDLLVLACQ